MDRLEAMAAFVATVDAGGFSAAARKLARSPASITRAVAALEKQAGAMLLRRTTRSVRLTEAGERYAAVCRRILADLAEADAVAAGDEASPRGALTVTAPLSLGRMHVRPIVDALVLEHRDLTVRLVLVDRLVNLVDEGVDAAVRVAHLPESALVAVKVGEIRRVVCASPAYLARAGTPRRPADLASRDCVSFAQITPSDVWVFGRTQVKVKPRVVVTSSDAAIASAMNGVGATCVLSYQVERELRDGALVRLLAAFEPAPLPVHVVFPASATSAKVRAFVDLAVPRLRAALNQTRTTR